MAFWDRVRNLEGKTLRTIEQNFPFDIVEVTHDRIVFIPQRGNGTKRWWPRRDLEQLYDAFLDIEAVSPADVREHWPNDQNTSYVAAILNAVKDE
jgi:hypothetical protein